MDIKPQDILFFITLIGLLYLRKPKLLVISGLVCLVVAIPLFSFWIFFTAQRLTWYAAAFFALSVVLYLLRKEH